MHGFTRTLMGKTMASVLVTGANRGLGLEFVRQLAVRGDRVIAACRHPGRARELNEVAFAHPGHVHVLPLDLARTASIDELAREAAMVAESIDLLINNAGVLHDGERFGALDGEALESSLRINAVGPLLLIQALAGMLRKGSDAKVANISSIVGSIERTATFRSPGYAIGKAALNMATRQIAMALRDDGISAFALHPGWVKTDMGTARAPLEPPESISDLLTVIDASSMEDSGSFRDYKGETIPW